MKYTPGQDRAGGPQRVRLTSWPLDHRDAPQRQRGAPRVRLGARQWAGHSTRAIFDAGWGAPLSPKRPEFGRNSGSASPAARRPRLGDQKAPTTDVVLQTPGAVTVAVCTVVFVGMPLGAERRMRVRRCGCGRQVRGIKRVANETEGPDLPHQIRGRARRLCATPLPPYGRGPDRVAQGVAGQDPRQDARK